MNNEQPTTAFAKPRPDSMTGAHLYRASIRQATRRPDKVGGLVLDLVPVGSSPFTAPIEISLADPLLAGKLPENIESRVDYEVDWKITYHKHNSKDILVSLDGPALEIKPVAFTDPMRKRWTMHMDRIRRTCQITSIEAAEQIVKDALGGRTIEEWLASGRAFSNALNNVDAQAHNVKEAKEQASKAALAQVKAESELNQWFPHDENSKPIEPTSTPPEDKPVTDAVAEPKTKQHEMGEGIIHAIPAHLKREHTLADNEIGKHIKAVFSMDVISAVKKFGAEKCWEMVEAYDAKLFADKKNIAQDAPILPEMQPAPVTTPEKPVVPASAPVARSEPVNVEQTVIDLKDEIRRRYNQPQRGKDYLVVQGRVLLFRVDHPDWGIETDSVYVNETSAVFKATIRNAEGMIVATGHGRATEINTKNLGGRYVEKAETAAIGRALALAGYGTDDSLDDSDYLSDSPKMAA